MLQTNIHSSAGVGVRLSFPRGNMMVVVMVVVVVGGMVVIVKQRTMGGGRSPGRQEGDSEFS